MHSFLPSNFPKSKGIPFKAQADLGPAPQSATLEEYALL